MSRKETTLEIANVEQYEAAEDLVRLLNVRFKIKAAFTLGQEIQFSYGDEFDRCGRCGEPYIHCYGHDDDPDYDDFMDAYD